MKRFFALLTALLLLCTFSAGAETYQKFQHYFFGTFDTIITVIGYAKTADEFRPFAELVESKMYRYHYVFDQYNAYDGVRNLHYVNANAANGPVEAEPELIDLLVQIRQWHEQYGDVMNPAMGSVLRLWHNAREGGVSLPDHQALVDASAHVDYSDVVIDEEAGTVYYADPLLKLDLGAVAKGYAAQLTANAVRKAGLNSFILNAGGNVICGDAPLDGRKHWVVAIEDVDGVSTRHKIGITNTSVVTSGDYHRYYEVDGQRYHHLIDPTTLYPATHMRAVTIIHPESGLSDFLSTTAFVLPYERSRSLVESIPGAEAAWRLMDGTEVWTDGFQPLLDALK